MDSHEGTAAALLAHADGTFTEAETVIGPGFYPFQPQGHGRLVGINGRAITVLDTGLVTVGGVDIQDADHLDAFAAHLQMLAGRLRSRDTRVSPTKASGGGR